jgi:hypothetical protein
LLRWLPALLAFFSIKYFTLYTNVRRLTFFIHVFAAIIAFVGLISADKLKGELNLEIIVFIVCSCMILLVDYHLTSVLIFKV